MKLPDPTPVSQDALDAISARHQLDAHRGVLLPDVGIINSVYLLGDDLVLRVPRAHPAHVAQTYTEAIAAPAARTAGVRTPRLVVFDDSLTVLPVPYTIYERIQGETLGLLDLDPAETPAVWRALGHDLALLHTGVSADGPCGALAAGTPLPDPRDLAQTRAAEGWFTAQEALWLERWLERLGSAALAPAVRRFVHGDVQATNVLIRRQEENGYLALIDWGGARWDDPASDFGALPLHAVPFVLEGYRRVAPLSTDETAEARIVWGHVQWSLFVLPRGAAPGRAWAERPLAVLLDVLRFALDRPDARWREVLPWPRGMSSD